jgi:hypothetical protein
MDNTYMLAKIFGIWPNWYLILFAALIGLIVFYIWYRRKQMGGQ